MKNIKKVVGWILTVVIIVHIVSYYGLTIEYTDRKLKNIYYAIRIITFFSLFVISYIYLLLIDINNNGFKFLKILHYLLFAGCVISMIFQIFITPWMGSFIVYFHMATIANLLIMTMIRYTVLKYNDISIKREWLWFGIWMLFMLILFLIPKGNLTQEYNVKMDE